MVTVKSREQKGSTGETADRVARAVLRAVLGPASVWPLWAATLGFFGTVLAFTGWWARQLEEALARLEPADEVADARSFQRAEERASEWAERLGFAVEGRLCLWRPYGADCDVIGVFAPDQPQIVQLRCTTAGCQARALGISAMPAP